MQRLLTGLLPRRSLVVLPSLVGPVSRRGILSTTRPLLSSPPSSGYSLFALQSSRLSAAPSPLLLPHNRPGFLGSVYVGVRGMAGHSKWKTIKHKKAQQDAKKSRVFSQVSREISTTVRLFGLSCSKLNLLLDKARELNMPKENIDKAIKKGTASNSGGETIVYEGHGPGGVAVMVESVTDNRNRTAPRIRHIFKKYGGEMGAGGAVGWMFKKLAIIVLPPEHSGDNAIGIAIENGADDVDVNEDKELVVKSDPAHLKVLKEAFEAAGMVPVSAEVHMVPNDTVDIAEEEQYENFQKMLEEFEADEDVDTVYHNFKFDESADSESA